ncbi:site-specific recombinase XerD [Cytobacillus firmus]|uniref:Site-specific recombinase XerD n=2 Tax=Cytobacillus TaxID=2675230 RepID=A0A366JKM3_CYTFI|nr:MULTISPECIES: site-specific integrase [Cytobacillus]RBP87869.1 site-specific recombinase XerD [Cytobacillus firmus]TDX39232.1 site-specific recombinase XerD [Cytobacillus oceanisediminis]
MASFRKRGYSWQYRIKYIDPATGKPKEKSKSGFRTKKEAQVEASEVEKMFYLQQHSVIANKETILKDWLNEWLEIYGSQCSERTLFNREFYINNHIIPTLGNYKLNQLTRLEYQKFINYLIGKGYAKKTVQTIHSIFCTSINKAVELEMISHNKYQGISIKVEEEEKINYLSRDEVGIFITAAKKSPYHHYMIASILLRTGMRKGEMLALKWDDINFENNEISITKTRSDQGVKKPKTKSSIRTIGIDNTLTSDLKQYQLWQKKNKMKYGADYFSSDFLVCGPNGKEMGEFGVNKTIEAILKKSKKDLPHISPHGLRHTHAIMLLESGADIKFVSEPLGHSTVNMTADVYVHITKKYETQNLLNLESYLS